MAGSEDYENEFYQPEFDSDAEADQFIRGVMACQVWARVVDEDAEELAELARSDDELAPEYEKMLEGEEHEFGVKMADHFGLPYTYAGDKVKLGRPYGERYRRAWVDLGVEPSMAEKIANSIFFGVLSRD